jgi:3-oxoadipate enol-lactonase
MMVRVLGNEFMLLHIRGRRLHYDVLGEGAGPVVLFAHALGADGGMWAEQVPAILAEGRRALRVDMRGHGGSDANSGGYDLGALADDLAAAVEACGCARVHYVGLSIGGMIGEAFALRHPEKTASLLLCETPPASLVNAKAIWSPRIAAVQNAGSLEPIADATLERWLTPAFKARNPGRWRQIRDTVAATSVSGYCGGIAALSDFDFTPALPTLKIPALVLYGEDDAASSHEENQRLAALIPGGRFHAFAGARHLPNVEDPARFNRIMMAWLREI